MLYVLLDSLCLGRLNFNLINISTAEVEYVYISIRSLRQRIIGHH